MLSLIFLAILFLSPVSESATKFTIINICPETIWPGMSSNDGSLDIGGFELKQKQSKDFTAPAGWSGRVWARTGCRFDPKGHGKCQTGACGDSLNCSGSSAGTHPVTLVELTLSQFQKLDFYDVSLIDGFNVPVVVTPINGQGNCSIAGCDGDLRTSCPPELAFKADGKTVGCRSACDVFKTAPYCCTGNSTCVPTNYSKIFKEACPTPYSYALDDANTMFTCSGADYVITFCSSRSELYPSRNSSPPPPPTVAIPPPPAPAPPPTMAIPPPNERRKSSQTVITVAVIISFIFFAGLVVASYFLFLKRKQKPPPEVGAADDIMTVESLRFDFGAIRAATNDFSDDNKLGQGGFGAVYKGRDSNGRAIAVKRLSKNSGQGEVEFKNEVLLLARVEHKNLVRLLGFCFERKERILIYELVKNSSLDNYIFSTIHPTQGRNLDWETRYKIITGIARGLLYLHEDSRLRIIHRDLKASNVLLDEQMNPKIADFGLARLFGDDQTQQNTGRIVGTFGYMPPEYLRRGQFSVKSDVYSFGVLVLEIVSGQRNSAFGTEEGDSLLTYTWKNWNEGRAADLIDDKLRGGSSSEMMRCIHIGLLCVQEKATERPTMASVSLMLGSNSITRQVPSKPAFFIQPDDHEHENSSARPPSSINKVSITRLNPR